MKKCIVMSVLASLLLLGCSSKGTDLGGDVYKPGELNTKQDTKVITILDILPARIAVDNSDNKKMSQTAGTIIGATTGAIIGYNMKGRNSKIGAGTVGVLGGTIGGIAGSSVDDQKIIEGVSIIYKDGDKTFSSTQAGKLCQFERGNAIMIMTSSNNTRIQANSKCQN